MEGTKTRLCFNCGSPDHRVDACPLPHDRHRINLSRQLFLFLNDHESTSYERIHVTCEWNRQRLEWVDMFTPGVIKSELLQAALDDEEYLKRIALWGYPKGWYNVRDPRELMKAHILTNGQNNLEDSTPVIIFGDENESGSEPGTTTKDSPSILNFPPRSHSTESEKPPTRWARYPCSYFDPDTLFVYAPGPQTIPFEDSCPPSLIGDQVSTFTLERQRLWESIISGEVALEYNMVTSRAPWRLPNAFSDDGINILPFAPPPAESPPPMPLLPPPAGPVEPGINDPSNNDDDGVLIRPAQPFLKSVSPYGLLFSTVGLNATAPHASKPGICLIDSPLSITSDMDISDTE